MYETKEEYEKNNETFKSLGLTQLPCKEEWQKRKPAWRCNRCGGIFYCSRFNMIKSPGCRLCGKGISYGEKAVARILTKERIYFQKEKTFKDLRGVSGGKLRFDFYVKGKNGFFIIEVDGKQHYKKIEYFANSHTKIHDKMKDDYCKKHNIPLYRIYYNGTTTRYIEMDMKKILEKECR